jgi:hypothetical protein
LYQRRDYLAQAIRSLEQIQRMRSDRPAMALLLALAVK